MQGMLIQFAHLFVLFFFYNPITHTQNTQNHRPTSAPQRRPTFPTITNATTTYTSSLYSTTSNAGYGYQHDSESNQHDFKSNSRYVN